jgi:hypothetical protein
MLQHFQLHIEDVTCEESAFMWVGLQYHKKSSAGKFVHRRPEPLVLICGSVAMVLHLPHLPCFVLIICQAMPIAFSNALLD